MKLPKGMFNGGDTATPVEQALLDAYAQQLAGVRVRARAEPVDGTDRISITIELEGSKELAPVAAVGIGAFGDGLDDPTIEKALSVLVKQIANASRGLHSDAEGNPLPEGQKPEDTTEAPTEEGAQS